MSQSPKDHMDPEVLKTAEKIYSHFYDAQLHLNGLSRRELLEQMLTEFANKLRAKDARKVWATTVIMWLSLITLATTLGPKLLDFIRAVLETTP